MNIVILDGHALNPGDNSWDALEALGTLSIYPRTAPAAIIERAKDADIIVTNKAPLTAATIAALPRLRLIAVTATGYNVVDLAAASARNIPVCNVVGYGVNAVAQHVMALLLELCRRTSLHDASIRAGDWANASDWCYWKSPQIELTGKVLGIVGFGNIGQRVGELGHAFGMEVMTLNRKGLAAPAYTPFSFVDEDTLFRHADVISLHCPLTADNTHMINAKRLATMKRGAILLNTARGPLLDEQAVAEALHKGTLGGFGADVLSQEPPAADNPLISAPNVLLTPHISWATLNARKNVTRLTADNIRAWQQGAPINVVNM